MPVRKKINNKQSPFQWISSETSHDRTFITIDKQKRLYFNANAQQFIDDDNRVLVGYDFVNKRLVVAKPSVVKARDARPFKLDSRGYVSARPFINQTGIPPEELPYRYVYAGKDFSEYPSGAHAFQLEGHESEDDAFPS